MSMPDFKEELVDDIREFLSHGGTPVDEASMIEIPACLLADWAAQVQQLSDLANDCWQGAMGDDL